MSNHDDLKRATENLLEVATILRRSLAIQPGPAVIDVLASAQRALDEEAKATQSPDDLCYLARKFAPLSAIFSEDGGYDCMTDAIRIYSRGALVMDIDLRYFGQESCTPVSPNIRQQADDLANLIVEAVNRLAESLNIETPSTLDIPALAEKCAATPTQQDSHTINLLTPVLRATDK